MPKRRTTKYIVVHTSASRPSATVNAKVIKAWHLAKGWKDIGYHFVINRDGTVEKGRNVDEIGAHVEGWNAQTLGICLVGGLAEKDPWGPQNNYTNAQWKALKGLCGVLVVKYPKATILGHRDLSPDKDHDGLVEPNEYVKACPCFDVRPWARAQKLPAAPERGL